MKGQIQSKSEVFNLPKAEMKPKSLVEFNDERIDNYYWLNDREDKDVIAYLNKENEYRDNMMSHLEDFQQSLFEEIKGRIKQTDMSVPYLKNGYNYITRYDEGKEYPLHLRKKENPINDYDAQEKLILDVNILANNHDYYAIGGMSISPDNQWLVYGEDTVSRRIYTLKIRNLNTGLDLIDEIPGTTGSAIWANDNRTIFYTLKDESLRSYKIMKHRIGRPIENDIEIYHEADDTFRTYVYKSMTGAYIIIGSASTLSTEYRTLNADNPNDEFVVFQERQAELEYSIAHDPNNSSSEERWLIRNNHEAFNFKLSETSLGNTSLDNWNDVIVHDEDVFLDDFLALKSYLILNRRIQGNLCLEVFEKGGSHHMIDFNSDAFTAYIGINAEYDVDYLRLGYTSMTTPSSTYKYDLAKQKLDLLKQQEVIGSFQESDYASERIFVVARDGVEVPVSIVYHKDFKRDASSPLLLYAYGSYGHSIDPYFSSPRLSLLDRGFVYVIAHIRGGQEKGRKWYEDGKLLKKKNTFTDFIDVAKALNEMKYCDPNQLFAMGGSAGGLLMGAVMNMAPELWRGVIAAVPFVDVLTTMLDETIPLTTGEFDEWGNPKNEESYHYMKSYSPIDNIRNVAYPTTLITTGLHDSQVQYWEPAKWIAKLRDHHTGSQPLMMFCNMTTGHGGASGRFARYKEVAMEYAFLLDLADCLDG